jgi:hypothetical protein
MPFTMKMIRMRMVSLGLCVAAIACGEAYTDGTASEEDTDAITEAATASYLCGCECLYEVPLCAIPREEDGSCEDHAFEFSANANTNCSSVHGGKKCIGYGSDFKLDGTLFGCSLYAVATANNNNND